VARPIAVLLCLALLMGFGAAPAEAARKARKARAAAVPAAEANAAPYGRRDDVLRFAAELAAREEELDPAWVAQQLAGARYLPRVAQLIMPPPAGTAKNWAAYRDRFIDASRIRAGLDFWRANEAWLAKAEALWGVPADIVVGIIGVETIYGRHTGGFRVLDALATLSFDFPAGRRDRSPFFRDELAQFLLQCRRGQLDCQGTRGSYAGAMGWPQFMPSSRAQYAVDFDRDGHIDLDNPADAIGSVAHYMARFGWQPGVPTHYAVAPPVDTSARARLLEPDIRPSFTAAQMAEHGAELSEAGRAHAGPLALVELQNGEAAPSYVAGTANFYTVTRYNWSSYYALAVIELGRSVAALRDARR
jgi:membrane-bound lytic murein transglycosylase B